ncbi:MAG TPA: transketolase [Candidatus Binatia bacterium]|jgi:transketolase
MTAIASRPAPAEVQDLDRLCIDTIRTLAMDAVQKADSGHPGTPMALAPAAYVMWTRVLRYDPKHPKWPDRDRFVLSCGHASMLLYSTLYLTGYEISLDDIEQFRQWGSITPGHPEVGLTPGIEVTTGPLGQGVGNAVGLAIAEKLLAQRFNRPGHDIVNHKTWGFCSDGDLMEGVASEAASLAGHLGLGNLNLLYDDNHITIEGNTALAFGEDVARRFEAYGWHVTRVADANDIAALERACREAADETTRPSLVISRSHIGYPAPHKMDTADAHGSPLGTEEVRETKQVLGWNPDESFVVPDAALAHWRRAGEASAANREDWKKRLDAYSKEFPGLAREFEDTMAGKLPKGWDEAIPSFAVTDAKNGQLATRKASGKVLCAISSRYQALAGGSADLAPSTDTLVPGEADFSRESSGRNFHWGVREHAMGAALNGMAAHGGVRPFGATFFIFSDYMRPSVRLAALSEFPVIYVWTHDSVGLGEDGPTHQPIEHLASLRAMPGMTLIRPADANETAQAWKVAIGHTHGPVGLVLTRQNLPILDPARYAKAMKVERGGYVLSDPPKGKPRVILIATGSEVSVALEAQALLAKKKIPARVVSMPSTTLFDAQSSKYRDKVLPPSIEARVSIEAGSTYGWDRYVGGAGASIGIDRFGASAPGPVNMKKFGLTADNVARRAEKLVRAKK